MDRRRSNSIEEVDLTREERHKTRGNGLRPDSYTSSPNHHKSRSKTSENDVKTMKFDSIVEHLSSNFMSDSLSKILAFLKAGNIELSFPNIDKLQDEFLVRIALDTENLYCDKFNKPCKGICRDILRVLESNRRVFKWVHLYESGMVTKRVLLYQKEYFNKKQDGKEPKPKRSSRRSNNSRRFTSEVDGYDPREMFLKAISTTSEESSINTNLDSVTKEKKSSTNTNLDSARKVDKNYKEGGRTNNSEKTPRSMSNYPKTTIQWQPANSTEPTTTPPDTPPRAKRAISGRHSNLARALAVPIEGGKARRMMQLMGWVGGGLGVRGEGITEPIMPALDIVVGRGLGHSPIRAAPRHERERDRKPRHRDKVRQENRDRKLTTNRKTSTVDFRMELMTGILKLLKDESSVREMKMGEAVCAKERRFIRGATQAFNSRKNVGLNTEEEIDLVRKILELMNSNSRIDLDITLSDDLRTITIMKKSGSKETSKRKRQKMAADLEKAKDDYNNDRLSERRTDNCQLTLDSKDDGDTDNKISQTLVCQANVDLLAQELKSTGRRMTLKALQSLAYRIILLKKVLNFVKSDITEQYVVFDHFCTTRMCKFAETIINCVNTGSKGGFSTRTENTLMRDIRESNDYTLKIVFCATRRKFALLKKDKIVPSNGLKIIDSENNRNNNNVEEEPISSRMQRLRKICDDVVTISDDDDDDGSSDSNDDDSSVDSICQVYCNNKGDSIEKDDENDSEGSIYDINDDSDDVKSVSNDDISDYRLIPKSLMISMDDVSEIASSSDTYDEDNKERKQIESGTECLEINAKRELIDLSTENASDGNLANVDDSRIDAIDKEIRDNRLNEKYTVERIEEIVVSSEDNYDDILELMHEEETIESVLKIGKSYDTDKHSFNDVHEVHGKEEINKNCMSLDTTELEKGDFVRILETVTEKPATLTKSTEINKINKTNVMEVKTTMNDIIITDVKSVSNESFKNVNDSAGISVDATSDDNVTLISNDVKIISNETTTIVANVQLLNADNDTTDFANNQEVSKVTLLSGETLTQKNSVENQYLNDATHNVADENAIKLNENRSAEEISNDMNYMTVLEVSDEIVNYGQNKLNSNENNQVIYKATYKMETSENIIKEVIDSSPGKRSRTDSECSVAQIPKKPKMQLEFLNHKILGIVPESYPTEVMDKPLAAKIQREMLSVINTSETNKPYLECHGINNGVLTYKCCDEKSSKWFENFIQKNCNTEKKIKILATDTALEKIKSKIKMALKTFSFLDENAKDVLKRIELYNDTIVTNNWDVLEEIIREEYILLTVQVDKDSYRLISESRFCLYAGIDKVEFSKILK